MKYYPLTPIVHEWIRKLLRDRDILDRLLVQYGSPVNIHNRQPFYDNVDMYASVLEDLALRYKIFFARKSNKCLGLIDGTDSENYGVDTASLNELTQSLRIGVEADNMVSTAAVKTDDLIETCIENNVCMIVDNVDEMDTIVSLAKLMDRKAKVGLRISGYPPQLGIEESRFGMHCDNILEIAKTYCIGQQSHLQYEGLHFHLNGYDLDQRSSALLQCIKISDQLSQLGLQTQFIDIGGGLLMNYLQDKEEWSDFHRALKAAVLGKIEEITYNNDGLGYIAHNDEIITKASVYPYYNEVNKAEALRYVLEKSASGGKRICDLLKDRKIELRIEPGRSLLDQVGITVGKVIHVKQSHKGDYLVGLDMNMTQLASGSRDYLVDPIHLSSDNNSYDEECYGYLTGGYCLERDIILKRKIKFEGLPSKGDLIIFINTAGYMMHFFETRAHQFNLAKNIFATPDRENGSFTFKLDEIDAR